MSDSTYYIKWLRLEAERPDYVSESDRMMFSGAADALEQVQELQRITADTVTQQDELLNMYSERIEQLEAALTKIRELPVNENVFLKGYAGAVREIAHNTI